MGGAGEVVDGIAPVDVGDVLDGVRIRGAVGVGTARDLAGVPQMDGVGSRPRSASRGCRCWQATGGPAGRPARSSGSRAGPWTPGRSCTGRVDLVGRQMLAPWAAESEGGSVCWTGTRERQVVEQGERLLKAHDGAQARP